MTKKKFNLFRKVWEWYAYLQAFLDDTIHYSIKSMSKDEKQDFSPEELKERKKIHRRLLRWMWKAFSYSIWQAWMWFYEKYSDLKQGENLMEKTINKNIPEAKVKWRLLLTKIDLMKVKKWDIDSIKKLKEDNKKEKAESKKEKKEKINEYRKKVMKLKRFSISEFKKNKFGK